MARRGNRDGWNRRPAPRAPGHEDPARGSTLRRRSGDRIPESPSIRNQRPSSLRSRHHDHVNMGMRFPPQEQRAPSPWRTQDDGIRAISVSPYRQLTFPAGPYRRHNMIASRETPNAYGMHTRGQPVQRGDGMSTSSGQRGPARGTQGYNSRPEY